MAKLDKKLLGEKLGGWDDKDGKAAKYESAGSNYRMYKPSATKTQDGGLFISTKLDHIRGMGGDDHCQLEITLDSAGKIVSAESSITMGDKSFDTGLIEAAALLTANPEIIVVTAIATEMYKDMKKQIAKWTDDGGRKNFPAVVKHGFNHILNSVV